MNCLDYLGAFAALREMYLLEQGDSPVKNRTMRQWVLSSVAALTFAGGSSTAQSPAPIVTKNASLRLPVSLDDRARADVAEIKLFVQGPSGRWEIAAKGPASQPSFDYKALVDGDYRFTFVTIDRRGAASPANVETVPPHRVVTVDTKGPELFAKPIQQNNTSCLQCLVQDASPDLASLRVSFLSSDGSWQSLHAVGKESPTLFLIPSPSVLEGKIRLTASDRAGNSSTREFDLADPRKVASKPTRPLIDRGRPDPASFIKENDAPPPPPPTIPDIKPASFPEVPRLPSTVPDTIPSIPNAPLIRSSEPPLNLKLPEVLPSIPEVPASPKKAEPDYKMPDLVTPAKAPDLKMPPMAKVEPSLMLPEGPMGIQPPIDIPPPPLIPPSTTLKPVSTVPDVAVPKVETKPAGTHKILNTRNCSLSYEVVEGVRFSNKMNFWATPDGGRTWLPLKDASDGNSPAKLTLPSDGMFGIRIRPGVGSKPPEPGEDPHCMVEVDATNPAVSLLHPTLGNEDGVMMLNWTASDLNLLGNSINLYYALKAEGPWEKIVSGYKNDGVYPWALPTGVSGSVYLRAEAKDRAGNIGQTELPTPIPVELGKLRVKVIGVEAGK